MTDWDILISQRLDACVPRPTCEFIAVGSTNAIILGTIPVRISVTTSWSGLAIKCCKLELRWELWVWWVHSINSYNGLWLRYPIFRKIIELILKELTWELFKKSCFFLANLFGSEDLRHYLYWLSCFQILIVNWYQTITILFVITTIFTNFSAGNEENIIKMYFPIQCAWVTFMFTYHVFSV